MVIDNNINIDSNKSNKKVMIINILTLLLREMCFVIYSLFYLSSYVYVLLFLCLCM